MGAKLVGLVEKDGSIYNPEGKYNFFNVYSNNFS